MAASRTKEAKKIKSLPWVEKVEDNHGMWGKDGYIVTTKPGALSCLVTRGVHVSVNGYVTRGKELETPIKVALPAYRIILSNESEDIRIYLTERPEGRNGHFVICPPEATTDLVNYWDEEGQLCLGDYEYAYEEMPDYYSKAQLMAEYLQTGIPHWNAYHGYGMYAYYNNQLPDEAIEVEKPKEPVKKAAKKKAETTV